MCNRGHHPILAQALHRFIDYPALYLDIIGLYVHTQLSCYIIVPVAALLLAWTWMWTWTWNFVSHMYNCTCITDWHYIIIATIYSPAIEFKKLVGHWSTHVTHPIFVTHLTHEPSTPSLLWCLLLWPRCGNKYYKLKDNATLLVTFLSMFFPWIWFQFQCIGFIHPFLLFVDP